MCLLYYYFEIDDSALAINIKVVSMYYGTSADIPIRLA